VVFVPCCRMVEDFCVFFYLLVFGFVCPSGGEKRTRERERKKKSFPFFLVSISIVFALFPFSFRRETRGQRPRVVSLLPSRR